MRADIQGMIKNALERGENLERIVASLISAGYPQQEVIQTAQQFGQGALSTTQSQQPAQSQTPQKLTPKQNQLLQKKSQPLPRTIAPYQENAQMPKQSLPQNAPQPQTQQLQAPPAPQQNQTSKTQPLPSTKPQTPKGKSKGKIIILILVLLILLAALLGTIFFRESLISFFNGLF